MYKLGFLTLVLSAVSAQVICDDNGVDGTCISTSTSTTGTLTTGTLTTGTLTTGTLTTGTLTTSTSKTGLNSSSGRKNSVMYIFGLLPLLFI